jgi:hypothetical protein
MRNAYAQAHEDAGEHVLHGDHLVIGGEDVLAPEAHLPVSVIAMRRRYRDGLGHAYSFAGPVTAAMDTGDLCIIQAACSSGVSITMRAGIRAWPMPQISVHWMS